MRIGFFLGSGCPLSIQIPAVDKTKALIPEINELTQRIKTFLDKDKDLNIVAQMAWDRVVARGIAMPTIEDVLNRTGFLGDLIAWEDGVYGTSKSVFSGGA